MPSLIERIRWGPGVCRWELTAGGAIKENEMVGHILERYGFAGLSRCMIVIVSLAMAASAGPAATGLFQPR